MKKILGKVIVFTAICFSLFILSGSFNLAYAKDRPEAVNGVLDLTEWNWESDGIVPLNGQWEFYWQELRTPKDILNDYSVTKKKLITVPMSWNKYKINGERLSGNGFATYRLLIHTPNGGMLGLKIPRIFTSYKLWINGQLIASNGKVAAREDQMIPQYLPTTKYIYPEKGTIELVVQVANFRHRSGGILESLLLGSEEQISRLRTNNLAFELFLFGSLFIIGFYHLGLFIFRTKDKSTLYFGIYCMLISLRTICVGEIFLINLFPDFNWEIAHKIQTSAFYVGVPFVFMFLKAIFPDEVLPRVNRFIQVFGFSFGLLVLLTPARIFTHFNPIYQLFTLIVMPYCLFIVLSACYKKRKGAYLIGIGLATLVLFAINDIIFLSVVLNDSESSFLRNFIKRGNLSSWGLLICVFAQSLVLAQKFSKSFTKVELISEELQELNESLEEKVKERTHALETSKIELEKAYKSVSRSEKSRQHLVQNISHDLRTPLTSIHGYVGAILDGTVSDPEQQKKYLRRVIDKASNINHMVQQLTELEQLESRRLKLKFSVLPLKALMDSVIEKYSLDVRADNKQFKVRYPDEWKDGHIDGMKDLFIKVDKEQVDRVFTNLFSNSLNYTSEKGIISLSFSLTNDQNKPYLLIQLSDTGIGISQEDLPYIFERFYKAEKSRRIAYKSTGLGLAIAKEIMEYHGGQIWAESKLGEGSQFFLTLPLLRKGENNVAAE